MASLNLGNIAELFAKLHVLLKKPIPTITPDFNFASDRSITFECLRVAAGGTTTLVECGIPYEKDRDQLELAYRKLKIYLLNHKNVEMPDSDIFRTLEKAGLALAGSSTNVDMHGVLRTIDGPAELGYSIKSFVGGHPTVFNANGKQTNFRIRASGYSPSGIDQTNRALSTRKTWKSRLALLEDLGLELHAGSETGEDLKKSLEMFGKDFPSVIASLLLIRGTQGITKISECVEEYCLKTGASKVHVEYAVKAFLRAIALGMRSTGVWDGNVSTYGGFLIVDKNAELSNIGIQNDDLFRDYLYMHSYFDSPTYSRHKFGFLLQDESGLAIDLALQIRMDANPK